MQSTGYPRGRHGYVVDHVVPCVPRSRCAEQHAVANGRGGEGEGPARTRDLRRAQTVKLPICSSATTASASRQEGRAVDSPVGPLHRGTAARRPVGALRAVGHREGAHRPGDHRLESARPLLYAVHAQPRCRGRLVSRRVPGVSVGGPAGCSARRGHRGRRCLLALGARLSGAPARSPAVRQHREGWPGLWNLPPSRSVSRPSSSLVGCGSTSGWQGAAHGHACVRARHARYPDLRVLRSATALRFGRGRDGARIVCGIRGRHPRAGTASSPP